MVIVLITLEPTWDEINDLPTPLTVGERSFVERIERLYKEDDSRHLEVFVQAHINGDRPDIVVAERGKGIWIVEVKDWNLDIYSVDDCKWYVQKNTGKQLIKSPFAQAIRYKKNVFSLHSHQLATRKLKNKGVYGTIKCGVYFHCATELTGNKFKDLENNGSKDLEYTYVLAQDSKDNTIRSFFRAPNTPIQDDEYNHLMRYIKPSEESRPVRHIDYNKKQLALIESLPKHQKIKGVAGSGKSLVLAARAVNALERTKGKILIVTFNITFRNYLHDRISEVRGFYCHNDFTIVSYHSFINAECNNLGIATGDLGDFESLESHYNDINLFANVVDKTIKYDAIFIDEAQDFLYEWQQILVKYFLKENGEFVLFGDEKQNIYQRTLEDKKIKTIIPGAWNTLSQSYRLAKKSTELADAFQKQFFTQDYEIDALSQQLRFDLSDNTIETLRYVYTHDIINELAGVRQLIIKEQIHPNDIVFLGDNKELMRKIDYTLRQDGERTDTTFTSLEEYNYLKSNQSGNLEAMDRELERPRKVAFRMNSGCTKISTTHSFKGWESNTIILAISTNSSDDTNGDEINNDELVYTGLTRCKKNLIILNKGDSRMHTFFKQKRDLFDSFEDKCD